MKIRKLFIGMTAAAMAAATMAMSASAATKLTDVISPEDEDFYSIGAMGFYMNRTWNWNQGDWVGITEDGHFEIEFNINPGWAMVGVEGETANTLGSMGIMFANIPEEGYPYLVSISDAKFVKNDGTEVTLDSWNGVKEMDEFPDGGIRIVIRGDDEVDEATGEVKTAATPEAAGWEEPGSFEGGTLYMTVDFINIDEAAAPEDTEGAEEPPAPESVPEDTDSAEEPEETTAPSDDTTEPGGGADSGAAEEAPDTGAAEGLALAIAAAAGSMVVASKKRK